MIAEFHDKKGQNHHDKFCEWRFAHFDDGFFLALKDSRRAQLHASHCRSRAGGGVNWDNFFGTPIKPPPSLTKKRKACSSDQAELLFWAEAKGIEVVSCTQCLDQPPTATHTDAITSAPASAKEAARAVEGIAREITVTARTRSNALRRAALKKAKGVCEACGTNYSKLLGGLGERVLQVHHSQQLALADEPKVNGIEDVAVVCANCHLMIHADMSNALPVEELRRRLLASNE